MLHLSPLRGSLSYKLRVNSPKRVHISHEFFVDSSLQFEELLEQLFGLLVFILNFVKGGLDIPQALAAIRFLIVSRGIHAFAIILNLLERLLHLDKAQGGGGAFEKVA